MEEVVAPLLVSFSFAARKKVMSSLALFDFQSFPVFVNDLLFVLCALCLCVSFILIPIC